MLGSKHSSFRVSRGAPYAGCVHYLPTAVKAGNTTLAQVQAATFRLFREYFALGLFDPPGTSPYQAYGPERVDTAAARQLALEAAQQGIILLQNNATGTSQRPLLPLRSSGLSTIAVIGPLANATQQLLSIYAGTNTIVNDYSPLAGISRRAANTTVAYAAGCADVLCVNTTGFGAAVATASAAQIAIVFIGLDHTVEDEGRDRENITLPGNQEALVQAVVATGTPVVVVLIHGGPLAIEWTRDHVSAIVSAHYPGELGGEAIAAVLFGDVSPSGRTTQTWYPAGFIARPMTDMDLSSGEGLTYMYYKGPSPLWPFGWGLSYTTFAFEWLDDSDSAGTGTGTGPSRAAPASVTVTVNAAARDGGLPPFGVKVTNTGSVASDVSALAFVSTGVPGQPISELFDFQRSAALAPGASTLLYFSLPPSVLATVTPTGAAVVVPGRVVLRIGGVAPSSSDDARALARAARAFVELEVLVTGDAVEVAPPPLQML